MTAGLLALFLGAFGIHKFYLGFTVPGVVYLLVSLIGLVVTCGIGTFIMGAIALVEAVIYLTKTDEEFEQLYVVQKKQWF